MGQLSEYIKSLPQMSIGPGDILMSDAPLVISTTLGSCVGVCFFDPVSQFGAMCHAMLPEAAVGLQEPFRFADESVAYLCGRYRRLGIDPRRLTVKVFGGASMTGAANGYSVGEKNVEVALRCLRAEGVKPIVSSVGGTRGRRLTLVSHTGDVYMRFVGTPRQMKAGR